MRLKKLVSIKSMLFYFVTLLLTLSGAAFNAAQAVSTGTVAFNGSEITSNIPENTHYKHDGMRKVSNNAEMTMDGERRVVLEEKWLPPGKPPDITIFTLKVTAKGQGRIFMTLNREKGGPTKNSDVGNYKGMDNPYSLDVGKNFYLYHRVPHKNIRKYEDGFDMPYDDECIPVKHKGYNLEVVSGTEDLVAKGKVYAEKVSMSNWGYKLIDDPNNTTEPVEIKSSFKVTVDDIVSIQEGEPQDPPCEVCRNCSEFIHNVDDHYIGNCPIDGTTEGCGAERFSCDNEVDRKWHKERPCYHAVTLPLPLVGGPTGYCPETFRHCNNSDCDYRVKRSRGHSDGTTPNPSQYRK